MGLQTPGEVVEANFGESPFVYDFDGMLTVSNTLEGVGHVNVLVR